MVSLTVCPNDDHKAFAVNSCGAVREWIYTPIESEDEGTNLIVSAELSGLTSAVSIILVHPGEVFSLYSSQPNVLILLWIFLTQLSFQRKAANLLLWEHQLERSCWSILLSRLC